MIVATLEVDLALPGCRSLKDKRKILRSLLERIRRDFRVSIAEIDDHDLWGNACLGVAAVSANAAQAESIVQHVLDRIDSEPEIEVRSARKEILRP